MHKLLIIITLGFVLTSCMSDKEAWLRGKDLEAKANHPVNFPIFTLKGKAVLEEGSEMVVQTPSQPFVQANIPDGQQIWSGVANQAITTGALTGISTMGIYKATGDTTKVINNAVEAGE